MKIDLHSHSVLSDGTDTPADLVARAAEHGVTALALTDHDHARGWEETAHACERHGIEFVPGIEVSTRFGGTGAHLLAFYPNPNEPALAEALRRTRSGRSDRLEAWVVRGAEAGIPIDPVRVRAKAGGSFSISKNHIADVLVEDGVVADRDAAHRDLLEDGKPLHIKRFAITLEDGIALVRAAGGVPVLAHAWGRAGLRRVLTADDIRTLAGQGLAGLEVDHQQHDDATRQQLRELADELGLIVTGSSDYHGTNKIDHELGCNTTTPENLERIKAESDHAGSAR